MKVHRHKKTVLHIVGHALANFVQEFGTLFDRERRLVDGDCEVAHVDGKKGRPLRQSNNRLVLLDVVRNLVNAPELRAKVLHRAFLEAQDSINASFPRIGIEPVKSILSLFNRQRRSIADAAFTLRIVAHPAAACPLVSGIWCWVFASTPLGRLVDSCGRSGPTRRMGRSRTAGIIACAASNFLRLGFEELVSGNSLLLFQQASPVDSTELPLETAILDLEDKQLSAQRYARHVLRTLGLLGQDIVHSASSEVMLQLFARLDDIRHIVKDAVHQQLVRDTDADRIRGQIHRLLSNHLAALLALDVSQIQPRRLDADDSAPCGLRTGSTNVKSSKAVSEERTCPTMLTCFEAKDLKHHGRIRRQGSLDLNERSLEVDRSDLAFGHFVGAGVGPRNLQAGAFLRHGRSLSRRLRPCSSMVEEGPFDNHECHSDREVVVQGIVQQQALGMRVDVEYRTMRIG